MKLNNLHEIYQSSYKQYHSCETALIKVQDDILRAVDSKKCVILVLLDLSAAFDTVDHKKLLSMLGEKLGLCGTTLKWFASYLSDRIQSVIIDGAESDVWKILFGVPQGSVLGPILFIIYTSSLGDILRKHGIMFHLYADDTQIYLSFNMDDLPDVLSRLEKCVAEIKAWMASHFLQLNASKTEILLIGSKHLLQNFPNVSLKIGSDKITPSVSVRNIGAYFDEYMSMQYQINHICKSAWYHLKRIGEIRSFLSLDMTCSLMHSFVSSRLDSFNSLLFGIPQQQLTKLQRIQNAAARLVTKSKKSDNITPILFKLHWLSIAQRIDYKILITVFKALHGLAPQYLTDLLQISKSGRNLRSNDRVLLCVPKTMQVKYGDRAFSCAGPKLWNKLPLDIRKIEQVDTFKKELKTYLFKQAFRNILGDN